MTMRVAGVLFRYGIAEEGDAVIEVEEVLCFLSECLGQPCIDGGRALEPANVTIN